MMTPRRDWLLQQMGITQWVLHRPTVLQGKIAITLHARTRLVIIAASLLIAYDPLIGDVLHSLSLRPEQVCSLTPEQTAMLPTSTHCHSWCLGVDVPLDWTGVQLSSPSLEELYANPIAKRALWQQISEHLPLKVRSEAH